MQRGAEVVGPEAGEAGKDGHAQHGQHQGRDQQTVHQQGAIAPGRRLGPQRHGSGRQHRRLPPADVAIDRKAEHRRRQQQQGHYSALGKVLLADDQLEDVGGHHVEVAADDLGDAKVGDHQREADQGGRDQAVFGTGQGDGEKLPHRTRAQRIGGLIQARVGKGQRGHQDHHRMRKDRKAFSDHHAHWAVNLRHTQSRQQLLEHALVAKPVDERDGRQQRRRKQRNQADGTKQPGQRDTRSHQGVGKHKGHGHHDHGDQGRNPQAVPQAAKQGGGLHIGPKIGQPRPLALRVLKGLHQNGQQGRGQKCQQQQQHGREHRAADPVAPVGFLPHRGQGQLAHVGPRPQ